jgi:hypothetical protein
VATLPSPRTWATGDAHTAARDNLEIRDALTFLLESPTCSLMASTVSTTSGVDKLISWDSETYDSDTMHSTGTNPSRVTATTAGVYLITGLLPWSTSSSGFRELNIRSNAAGSFSGGTLVRTWRHAPAASAATHTQFNWQRSMTAGEYLEFWGTQTSGGALDLTGYVQMTWLRKYL